MIMNQKNLSDGSWSKTITVVPEYYEDGKQEEARLSVSHDINRAVRSMLPWAVSVTLIGYYSTPHLRHILDGLTAGGRAYEATDAEGGTHYYFAPHNDSLDEAIEEVSAERECALTIELHRVNSLINGVLPETAQEVAA